MTFDKVYKLPLVQDECCSSIVWTSDDLRAFDFYEDSVSVPMMGYVIAILNGTLKLSDFTDQFSHKFERSHKNGTIYQNSQTSQGFIDIRGLGHMTGSLHMTYARAYAMQDVFAKFIIDKLTKQ